MRTMLLLSCLLMTPVAFGVEGDCVLIPDGDFSAGQGAWAFTPLEVTEGNAAASAQAAIIDASMAGAHFDEQALALNVFSTAGATGTGEATAVIQASIETMVTDRFLRFPRGGGFEFLYFGLGDRRIQVAVEIVGPANTISVEYYDSGQIETSDACEPGLSVLGSLDGEEPFFFIDLLDSGFEIGDPIGLTFEVSAMSSALVNCQQTEAFATFVIDDVSMCSQGPDPSPDLNGDGLVNAADLAILLGAWGPNPGHAADLNEDGQVNAADLAVLLGAWGPLP